MKIYHWWPGREWGRGYCPIDDDLVSEAKRMGSRYLTVVQIEHDGNVVSQGVAFCRATDQARRDVGTGIAFRRAIRLLR